MGNETFETISTVMAVREYDGKPIPDDVIHRIAEAGRLTASAGNQQPWHFVFVQDREGLHKLGALVRTGPYTASAPAAVIVAYLKEKGEFGVSDASRAVQSMMLAAWAEGVGSNWTGFAGRLDNVREAFGLPGEYDVLAVVPLGYPKRKVVGRKKRKPLGEVASAERFGQPMR